MKTKTKVTPGLKVLSATRQSQIQRFWDARLKDPLAFVPKEQKAKRISPTEARSENVSLGKFADVYVKRVLTLITKGSDPDRRRTNDKKIVGVGFGNRMGYGTKWLRQATKAGFQTWWIDVSSVAWIWATQNLENQFDTIPRLTPTPYLKPVVRTFEIQSLLAKPREAELDLADVEVWYLCRLLNCLSTRSAKVVLQEIGRTTLSSVYNVSKRGAVIVVNALSDHNPVDSDMCGHTSIRRSRKMILSNLARGAGCRVESRYIEYYNYFGKAVTAMTVMAME